MQIALVLLLVLNLGLLLAVAMGLAALRRRLRELEQRSAALGDTPSPVPAGAAPGALIIEILNPLELAAKQSKLAGALGGLTPELVRKLVYLEVQKILRAQLEERGVKADVRLHAPA